MATSSICPEGHQSADPEWCDTCGSPISGAGTGTGAGVPAAGPAGTGATASAVTAPVAAGSPPPVPPGPVGPTVTCAHCGTLNELDALFCESCGFDFTTGQAPPPPVAPVALTPDPVTSEPTDFSVEVAVDPAWYALQGAESNQPCPPPTSVVVPVRTTTVLIGRTSSERSLAPEIALNDDPGVSRRHAQLVQAPDGSWSAVDQGSMNGTYVVDGPAPSDPPAPIPVGEVVPLRAGSRVFVGAWTCITVIDHRTSPR